MSRYFIVSEDKLLSSLIDYAFEIEANSVEVNIEMTINELKDYISNIPPKIPY